MRYRFYTADVFSQTIFGGNPLAIFPQASGLKTQQMQKIAAEFNLSETVFVLPPETSSGTRHLRIFTPAQELPFAGHPTIGAAYVLAAIGEIAFDIPRQTIIFEEEVGDIPVVIYSEAGKPVKTELSITQAPEWKADCPEILQIADILSLNPEDIRQDDFMPEALSCGIPYLFVPLKDWQSLSRIHFNQELWQKMLADTWASSLYVFSFVNSGKSHFRARMFAPGLGITEDPATGSAAAAFVGYLARRLSAKSGQWHWRIEQGIEMGRPSLLEIRLEKQADNITTIGVGGASVLVSEGVMEVPTLDN